jgi:hypothetical protein
VSGAGVLTVAVPFVWLGMVLAISFLEAPLKFRAPGITLPLGLGIGRLVFRALNGVEIALAALLVVGGVSTGMSQLGWLLLAGLVLLLVLQVLLRPRLDQRAMRIVAGRTPPPSRLHLAYIALEGVKVFTLPVLGMVLATSVLQ